MTADRLVYVVDDDEKVRRALSRLIRSVGLDVQTFPSAKAFLEHELPDRPACLVLDLRLRGPSGLDLQTTLAEKQLTIPIIFISGHGTVPASVRAMKGGALDFLEKPFDDAQLLDSIERALSRSRDERLEHAERSVLQRRMETLTPREREVMALVVRGMLNKQIAAELGAAEKTIKIHRGRVMKKMQAESVAELIRMAQRLGVDSPTPRRLPA
ncbi:MAG TPA: response regulator transcription factor [Methylomirabilota bacterium]|jgi:FixJ family two-component response regulator